MNTRLERLRLILDTKGLDCVLITRMENVRYLSGFRGSGAAALVTAAGAMLITDGRYREQAAREAVGWDVHIYTGAMTGSIAETVPDGSRCGFEATCSFDFYRKLSKAAAGRELEPLEGIVEGLRIIKDAQEVASIKVALECAARGFNEVAGLIKPGITERALAAELDYRMMLAGADGPAFDTVVASGPNSALPHAPITDRVLAESDLVVVDFGAVKEGYRSDTTRTLAMPRLDPRGAELLEVVRAALGKALKALQPEVRAAEVDAAARERIAAAGFADNFSHSLGHGVGLETHEKPTISAVSDETLEPGMVFSLEPGIYIEGYGGVRIEEMVLMTGDGPEVLSRGIPLAPA